jgi:hypothetical protein
MLSSAAGVVWNAAVPEPISTLGRENGPETVVFPVEKLMRPTPWIRPWNVLVPFETVSDAPVAVSVKVPVCVVVAGEAIPKPPKLPEISTESLFVNGTAKLTPS